MPTGQTGCGPVMLRALWQIRRDSPEHPAHTISHIYLITPQVETDAPLCHAGYALTNSLFYDRFSTNIRPMRWLGNGSLA